MDQPPTRIVPLTRADLPTGAWSAPVPIRLGHCDAAGIVFTPRYFELFNEVIEQFFLRRLAVDYYAMLSERRIGLGYAKASCEFLRPSRMGETLEVAVLVERVGRSSYTLVLHALKEDTEVVRGRFVTVTTVLDTRRSRPLPDDVRGALLAYQEGCRPAA